jgi:hypothetical protein
VREVSISPEHFGTPAHPSFRVEIDEPAYDGVPAEVWYMEKQLRLAEKGTDDHPE